MITPCTDADRERIREQLGRMPRGVVGVAARAAGTGEPLVVATAPRLEDGTPFPTTYYLTHPEIVAECSRMEANGVMAEFTERLAADADLRAAYAEAHRAYLADRSRVGAEAGLAEVTEIEDFSAGGMPTRVKCLHALVGHSLAAGPGTNPVGDEALARMSGVPLTEAFAAHLASAGASGNAGTEDSAVTPGADRPAGTVRTAAFDCGTNSLRLLVADVAPDGTLTELAREMRVVRLGQGVDATGEFAPEALERTFAVCEEYAEIVAGLRPDRQRFVATSASRDVSNRDVFAAGVRERLGIAPEVIEGVEEAALSFRGATAGLDATGPHLVMDLGGGSTELVLGSGEVAGAHSMNIGCVRLFERWVRSDPPAEAELGSLRADVDQAFAEASAHVDVSAARTLVGVAGTITTLAAAALELDEYDREAIHGSALTRTQIVETADRLSAMTADERRALPYMHPGRADVIAAGAQVFSRLVELIDDAVSGGGGTLEIRVSESDILDGIALGLASPEAAGTSADPAASAS
ncbi:MULTISPECIES: DUF501 domain-containing protein [Brevibacterium]|uniref:Ppx/GppA phosphatase N-terminal domain-containing protein n=1 Tax=Brevibacterium salitolerans TaxID=1403566 RepID=A0ABN2W9S5_9MICO|nr:DUF501 domain-containing protein [Brevibacterium sp.]